MIYLHLNRVVDPPVSPSFQQLAAVCNCFFFGISLCFYTKNRNMETTYSNFQFSVVKIKTMRMNIITFEFII